MLRFLFFVYILLSSLFEPCALPRELHCEFVRQMRNRDSAMKSRERKRTYVKGIGDKEQVFGGRVPPPQLCTSVLCS
jgi:hypothetical protein